jgi:hypothetical protein
MAGIEPDHEIKHSDEYRALTTYLSAKPQPLSAALESFCKPTEDTFMSSQSASEVESQLWRVWKAVVATATQTPHDSPGQQKLADFVLELRNRPVLERQGTACKVWDAVVWKDLPILGPQMREAWNDGEFVLWDISLSELIYWHATPAATDSSHHHARSAWINLNAFTATLVATIHSRSISFPPDNDFSLYAIWTIRMALEDNDGQQKPDKTSLEAAAAWFAYAAPTLWNLSQKNKDFQGKIAKQGQAMQGKEWRGFSQERWEHWEERLKASGGEGLVAKANEAIGKAKGW